MFNLLFHTVFIFLLVVWKSDGQLLLIYPTEETCITTSRTQGSCIVLNECNALLNLLKGPRPLPPSILDTLKRSHCGFDGSTPKVCCPQVQQVPPTPPTQYTDDPTNVQPPPDVTNHPNLRLLDHDKCGPITESKIFGGNKTAVLEFPWMALVAYNIAGKRAPEFRCGGSLISKRYVLTAAHCVTGLASGLKLSGVRVGEHDLSTERDCDREKGVETNCAERYQDFLIERFHAHEGYRRDKLQNDIALIRLNGDADFRPPSVRPICLPIGSASTLHYKKVTVTGWGTTETGYRSNDLLKVKLPIVPNEQCAQIYKEQKVDIWYKQLCAGGSNRMDSCSGDSGGPLQAPAIYTNGQPKYIQYGVVSFGPRNCGIEGFPGVYSSVVYYMKWILDTMTV
ncbi:CLIP domain-containing serine protease HP8-like isoform X1 [Athalia rosae]|uniref:CLIP domain-containing serine protease HP8-like isoform X1 n=1 Tax=Athalia rosae TaxID=37344 RepID=UPI0020339F2A|nr:CLIP domain-containing serine protease HP8-like isoform X1 [Athalia rosae]